MADDQDPTGPSLEPPSLFGRKRKRKKLVAPQLPTPPTDDDSPTTILDDVAETPTAVTEAVTEVEPQVEPEVADSPVSDSPPMHGPKPAAPPPLFADEAPAAADLPASSDPSGTPDAPESSPIGSLDAPAPAPKPRREGPLVPGPVAAAITGLLVGGLIVGLTTASFSLCEEVQGTDSCGGPGFFLLVAILILAVVLGSLVLRLCGVRETGSTSFLAVGITSVIALLFLVDQIFEWWMLIAIPVVSVASYLLSYWVTATFVDEGPKVGLAPDPEVVDHDVR
jgi:hypothetical protein